MKVDRGDSASIDELELSVRASNALENAGVKTVGALRKLLAKEGGLATVKLGSKLHTKAIVEVLADWDKDAPTRQAARDNRIERARAALVELTEEERRDLFVEVGACPRKYGHGA